MNQPNAATADPVVREGEFTEAIFPPGKAAPAVYVYEAPVRLWHWVTALCIFALAITGFLIGSPPTSIGGEASDHFQFGWIRLIHFSAGQILGVAFILRVFWAFVGNSHSRQLFVLPVIFMMLTGFALYAEGAGIDSAWYAVFGWVFGWLGSSMAVHTLHHFVMYVLLMFTTVHLYIGLREDIVRRQSTLSTMVNGWRMFKNRGHWGT